MSLRVYRYTLPSLLVAALAVLGAPGVRGEGDELLQRPDQVPGSLLTVATGTGVAVGGVGLATQPATLEVEVPAGATVKQVILYVVGRGLDLDDVRDDTAVNGVPLSSTVVGKPNLIGTGADCAGSVTVSCPDPDLPSHTFRKDITALGLVGPGANSLEISGVDFGTPSQEDGAGVVVIYDDGGPQSAILLADGNDFDWWQFDNAAKRGVDPLLGNTVPVTFPFAAAPVARTAKLALFFSDGTAARPDEVLLTVAGATTTLTNVMNGADGPQWDTLVLDVEIPADASEVTVEPRSPQPAEPTDNPDSFSWAVAVISVPGVCVGRIGDYVWEDMDADGCQDPEEKGIEGVLVTLRRAAEADGCACDGAGELVAEDHTDSSGAYLFEGLCPGKYCVEFEAPEGYIHSPPNVSCVPGDDASDSDCDGGPICVTLEDEDLTIDCGLIPPPPKGGEGCTPGYWKQPHHFDSWAGGYLPSTKFSEVFEDAFPGKTLLQVLKLQGGGLEALGRHTVAALLNAASGDVNYDLTVEEVIELFDEVYPGSKADFEALKDSFEDFNQQGCPLS